MTFPTRQMLSGPRRMRIWAPSGIAAPMLAPGTREWIAGWLLPETARSLANLRWPAPREDLLRAGSMAPRRIFTHLVRTRPVMARSRRCSASLLETSTSSGRKPASRRPCSLIVYLATSVPSRPNTSLKARVASFAGGADLERQARFLGDHLMQEFVGAADMHDLVGELNVEEFRQLRITLVERIIDAETDRVDPLGLEGPVLYGRCVRPRSVSCR